MKDCFRINNADSSDNVGHDSANEYWSAALQLWCTAYKRVVGWGGLAHL